MNPFSSFNIPGFSFGGDLQKQIVLFLLKKTLGSFVKTEFKIDNLDFQFFQGRASLREIEVNVEVILFKLLYFTHIYFNIRLLMIKLTDSLLYSKKGI
jgi:hypothetical protein